MARSELSDIDRTVTGTTRIAVLDTVRQANKALDVQQIAAELGLHANTVRFHLARLIQASLVQEEQADPSGPGRPRMVYTAGSAAPATEPQDGYPFLAEILAGHLAATAPSPAGASIAAGEVWGRYLAERPVPFSETSEEQSLQQLRTLLDQLGFAPEESDDGRTLLLHHCPFRKVADRRPSVVCSIHLGIMRGALTEMGAPIEVADLERFDAPHPCIARLQSSPTPPPAPA
jgi:predicted ArsR family transcriptional regulator